MSKDRKHTHKNCPECALEVHESLVICPHCGSGLVDLFDDDLEELLEESEEGTEGSAGG